MMKKYTLVMILFGMLNLQAQQFEWLATPPITFNSNSDRIGYPSASDNQGNTFVCGFKDTPYHYTDTFGNLWLLKYDANGQLLFSKTITGTVSAYDMETDANGNLYMVATYINQVSIDNLNITSSLQGVKPIFLKFDTNGNLVWHKLISIDYFAGFKSLAIDSSQNVYIGYDNFQDSFIEKLDPNGNSLMLITQPEAGSLGCIDVDNDGNIYCGGSCASMNVNFNGTGIANTLLYNTYIVKYNAAGQFQWVHFVDDITCPQPRIVVRSPDEVYFSSTLYQANTFGAIATDGPQGGHDFFLAKLNAAGEYQWVKEIPGTGIVQLGHDNFLTLDGNGNPYLAVQTRGPIQWTPTISTQSVGFGNDILLLKYNPQGELLWTKMAGGNSQDRADGISVLPDDSLILTGMVYGNVAFDAITHTTTATSYYPYVAKLTAAPLSNPNPTLAQGFLIYPNPAAAAVTIKTANYRGKAHLFSILGQELKTIEITAEETSIDLSALASGTYFIRLDNEQTGKFVKL